ncbi:piercer of microtubule wall 1 protein isoform X2 [Ovis aries]|uniref:Uncharacterized protein n=2 Tax=Ovis aries TaxID=9940 RepID=A0AC11AMD6_SHEEP|nr:piercer of microtubule wall 1 protein isoform X2 [Ovis aries]
MSEEDPQACAEPEEPKAGPPPEKTSDCYRVSEDLPARFNNPAWFRGYRTKEPPSVYRTSNQVYGSRAPTVHEMPGIFPTQRSSPGLLRLLPASLRTGPIHSYEEPALVGSRFGQMNEGLLPFWRLTCDPRRQHWVVKAQVPKGLWSLRLWGSGVLSDRLHMAGASSSPPTALLRPGEGPVCWCESSVGTPVGGPPGFLPK